MRITRSHYREDLVTEYAHARKAEEDAKRARLLLEEELMAYLTKNQEKSAEVQDGGKQYRVTYVQGETVTVNEASLKKALGATTYRKYTKESLDRKALEEAMQRGEVDPITVGQHVSVHPSKPFLRYTEKEARTDEHQG